MDLFNHGFEYDDLVQFVGRRANELRSEGRITTGVVVFGEGEGDPRVHVELDLEENSGSGGGAVLALCAPNWWLIGQPIVLSQKGKERRREQYMQESLRRMESLPSDRQNPRLLEALRQRVRNH